MKAKLTLNIELIVDVAEAHQKAKANYTVWTLCHCDGEEFIEKRITTTNAVGYVIIPNVGLEYNLEMY